MPSQAAIDIGTHSALLLIAEVEQDRVFPVLEEASTTYLGEGLQQTGRISEEAMARLMTVLSHYSAILSEYSLDRVLCFGTAVFRRATNAAECQQQIEQRFGWPLRVLTGEEEALYGFQGVMQAVATPTTGAVAIDIGGGSTEVIIGNADQIEQSWSFPTGAVLLKEQFNVDENLTTDEAQQIDAALMQPFQAISADARPVFVTGGTATTLAALLLELHTYDIYKIDGCSFSREQLDIMYDELNRLSLSQRADLPGMEPGRAGVILPAMRILFALMDRLQANQITVTVRGARYGILGS